MKHSSNILAFGSEPIFQVHNHTTFLGFVNFAKLDLNVAFLNNSGIQRAQYLPNNQLWNKLSRTETL